MNITFLAPCKDLSGGIKAISIYGNKLIELGHRVTVVYPKKHQPWKRKIKESLKSIVDNTKDHLDRFNGTLLALDTIDDDTMPVSDVLIATAWETAEWSAGLSKNKGVKFYFIQGYETWNGQKERVVKTYNLPFKKITISSWLKAKVSALSFDDRIDLIPNGSDFGIKSLKEGSYFRRYDIGLTYSAIPNKGCHIAVASLWELYRKRPSLKFVIFGSEKPMEDLPPNTEVIINPTQKHIEYIYRNTRIWLSSSFEEGFCLPCLEAMSCGSVIITSDSKGVRDFVDNGYNGFLVPTGSSEEITKKTMLLLKSPQLMCDFQKRGIEKSKIFNWDKSAALFNNLLTEQFLGKTA